MSNKFITINYIYSYRLRCQVYGLRIVSWWLCVCFIWLDMTTPPWCMEKIIFVPALLLSMLTHLFLSSSLSLSYFILAVPIRKCLGKHSCMSSSFPIFILNDTSFFPTVQLQVHNANPARYGRNTDALVNLITKLNQTGESYGIF